VAWQSINVLIATIFIWDMLHLNNRICVGRQAGYNFIYTARVAPEKTIIHRPAISVPVNATDELRLKNDYS
jgi:hypothetical protein